MGWLEIVLVKGFSFVEPMFTAKSPYPLPAAFLASLINIFTLKQFRFVLALHPTHLKWMFWVCKHHMALRVNRSGCRGYSAYWGLFSSGYLLSLSLYFYYTHMALISQKSSKILMVPIIGKYKPQSQSHGSGPWIHPFMTAEETPLTARSSVTWVLFSE